MDGVPGMTSFVTNALNSIPGCNRVETCLVFICDTHRTRILYLLELCLLGLGCGFFAVAVHTPGTCYVDPCLDDTGVDSMYKVDGGLSFEVIAGGLCYMLHPLAGLYLLFKKGDAMTCGVFIGVGAMCCLGSLCDSVIWGSEATMISDMSGAVLFGGKSNTDAGTKFSALSTLAGLFFALELISLAMLTYAMESISSDASSPKSDGVSDAYSNYASQQQQQQPPPFQQQPQSAHGGGGLASSTKSYGAAPQDQHALLGGTPDDDLDPNGEDDNPFQVV